MFISIKNNNHKIIKIHNPCRLNVKAYTIQIYDFCSKYVLILSSLRILVGFPMCSFNEHKFNIVGCM